MGLAFDHPTPKTTADLNIPGTMPWYLSFRRKKSQVRMKIKPTGFPRVASLGISLVQDREPALAQSEEGAKPFFGELLEINLGTEYEPRPTFISGNMPPEENKVYVNFLKKNRDVSMTYTEMIDLCPRISMHHQFVGTDNKLDNKGRD